MAAARHFGVAERRRRLVERHFLASPGPNIEFVAGAMVGLHATDPATFALSLWARLRGFRVSDLDDALYERHSVLRMLGMRRTMFVVPRDLAAVIDAACTRDLVVPERRKLVRMLEDAGITTDGEAWIDDAYRTVLATLACHPALSARELGEKLEVLRRRVTAGAGSKWAVDVGVASRILLLLAAEGYIVRDRPTGGWLSSQHRWSRLDRHFAPWPALPRPEARATLLTRWLRTFGPGTLTDITWWAKWTKADVRAALAAVGAAEVTADDGGGRTVPAYVLADDLDAPEDDERAGRAGSPGVVSLLPALDSSIMGWKQRDWYVDPGHVAQLFDSNGNAGPVVMCDGRVIGAWAQRADATVVTSLLEPVSRTLGKRIDARAAELSAWLDGTRVVPRFPTPLQRRLAAAG